MSIKTKAQLATQLTTVITTSGLLTASEDRTVRQDSYDSLAALLGDNAFVGNQTITGRLGIGVTATLPLHVRGEGVGSLYTAKFEAFGGAEIAYFRDDKRVTFGSNFTWNTSASIGLAVNNIVALGNGANANISANNGLTVRHSFSASGADTFGIWAVSDHNKSSGTTTSYGAFIEVGHYGTGTNVPSTVGLLVRCSPLSDNNFGADKLKTLVLDIDATYQLGTIADSALLQLDSSTWFTIKPTTHRGIYIKNQGFSGITNSYAQYIDTQSGSTNNYGLVSLATKNGFGTASPVSLLSAGTNSEFQVNTSGNIIKINNITYSWPSVQGTAGQFLSNNGSGTLSWANQSNNWTVNGNDIYNNNSGNVGIGTATSPIADLQVQGTTDLVAELVFVAAGVSGSTSLSVYANGGTVIGGVLSGGSQTNSWLTLAKSTSNLVSLHLSDGTAPSTPTVGHFWVESTNERYMIYRNSLSAEILSASSANAVSPTSPNRTITVRVGGQTYYIAAKTTND